MAKQTTKRSTTCSDSLKTRPSRRNSVKCTTPVMPSEEQIRVRAYEIYLRRGGGPGDPQADWAQAERELFQELNG